MVALLKRYQDETTFPCAHPVLHALRSLQKGILSVTLPGGREVFFHGAEPGTRADMNINDWSALDYIETRGDVGLGEGYMQGLWDTGNLKNILDLLEQNRESLDKVYVNGSASYRMLYALKNKLRLNTAEGSVRNIQAHYDLGNDFYRLWLDETMTYSGALFKGGANLSLEAAQKEKYQRILDRLSASPGDHVLEIGCGWGAFMEEAARRGYRVTGITLSQKQATYARARLEKAGLEHLAEVRLQDYRDVSEKFRHIVSIGMFEHVGEEFWPEYMTKVHQLLEPGGKAIIESIVVKDDRFKTYRSSCDFAREHIFPGSLLPSLLRFKAEAERAGFKVTDTFFFGPDYAITMEKWLKKFDTNLRKIRELGYDEDFIRKWRFYLSGRAAAFRHGRTNLMQAQLDRL